MNSRFINWIWHVRGSLDLAPGQSSKDAFDKLDPLFRERGTTFDRTSDTLTFRKKNQAPQDKMSVFDGGVLQVESGAGGPVLHYHLISRALLFCFLAPLLFLAFAQLTVFVGDLEKQSAESSDKAKEPEKKEPELKLNPIDIALGAPAPEKPDKDEKKKEDEGPSPTPAYVFAAIFATLYVAGRILEAWLVKALFKKNLLGT